ncbi:hypothetical protein BD560DRAFT_405866 [Blakeslea trispora]|nr:hypothetical protein BD560DRAFT_405866 [Blakeslea trispora]
MDEDQEICRVCRSESTPDHPLYHPCKCSGSIRFVHEDCLIEWLSHSRKKYCELCEHPFTFSPIYRDDMPEKVPFYVLCSQLIRRLMLLIKTCLRGLVVGIVWLVILPNFTLWTWRFYFWSGENIGFNSYINETTQEPVDIETKAETIETGSFWMNTFKTFLSDCLEGQIITAFVIIIFVAAYLFREWVMQNLPAEQPVVMPVQAMPAQQQPPQLQPVFQAEDNQLQEQVAIDTLLNAMQVINSPQEEPNHLQLDDDEQRQPLLHDNESDEDEPAIGSPVWPEEGEHFHHHRWDNEYMDEEEERMEDEEGDDADQRQLNEAAVQRILQQHLGRQDPNNPRDILAAFERELMMNNNNRQPGLMVPAQAQEQAQAAEEDEPLDIGDDMNGVLEAIGLRGNPWMLVQNSVLMSLMISLCLGIAVWIPYVVGRLVIMIRPITFVETPIYMMRLITDPLVDFVLDFLMPSIWSHLKPLVPKDIQSAVDAMQHNLVHEIQANAVQTVSNTTMTNTTMDSLSNAIIQMDLPFIQSKLEAMGSMALVRWHRFATGHTGLDRSMCILVGYLVLIGLGSWYLTQQSRRRRHMTRRRTGSASETVQNIIRQQGIFLKVLFFILIELVVFPTVCGFLLDLATLPLFANASIATRYIFHLKSPYSSYFLHWFLGTGVLFYFAIFITVCREIIRPGVMWFIRDPNDPQFHPVQEMVERPFPNLLHKISQSALIYSVMLVFGVGTVTYSLGYTSIVFPLRLPFHTPLSTLAVDLLIIQFLLPPLVNLVNPRAYSKKALDLWWHLASRQLRLTSFMFNQSQPDEQGRFVYRSWKAWLLRSKPDIPDDDVSVQEGDVVFVRDGTFLRVPKYDSVPVDPKRRMLVPVDPVTLEALDEQERSRMHPAAADTMDESQSTIVVYAPPHFKQRIIIFLIYMWFSISVFTCSVTVVPLLLGRILFSFYLAPDSHVNDLYSFALGIYLMVAMAIVAHWIYDGYILSTHQVMTYLQQKLAKVAKFFYLASTFGFVMPLLLGIAVDLFVFMPIRSSNSDKGLVIHLSQNWSFGVAYMSIIHHLIHVLPANNRIRQKLNEIIGEDMMQANLWNITRSVIVPVIASALLAIIAPGMISWGILQMLGDPSLQIVVTRYTYPIIFCIVMSIFSGFIIKKLIDMWLQSVRDDTYLIGKRLHNMPLQD